LSGEPERPQGDAAAPSPWTRRRSEQLADCRVFRVRRDLSADPRDGREHDFYVLEAPDWINVIPLTEAGEVVLVEQYRHGTGAVSLEIPGGMVDPGEAPEQTAARELLEETGYGGGELAFLGRTRPNPAIQDNWLHSYVARGVSFRHAPSNAGTEQTVVRFVPVGEVPRLIREGRIDHALVVAAFHLWSLCEKLS
jgi:8-oxo-dGTP pyrophosphatase MutT (NUDIX family)